MIKNIIRTCIILVCANNLLVAQSSRIIEPCYTPPALDAVKGKANIEADIPFVPYDASKPYDQNKGKGEVQYFFRLKENDIDVDVCTPSLSNLKRPIIIIDGFDPGDSRDITKIYNQRLVYNGVQNLGQDLRNLGYDVIILNFPKQEVARVNFYEYLAIPHKFMVPKDTLFRAFPTPTNPNPSYKIPVFQDHGGDYVERNAFTLVKLIQQTNDSLQKYGSTEKLVIVGASMGGLISRYALAYMERTI